MVTADINMQMPWRRVWNSDVADRRGSEHVGVTWLYFWTYNKSRPQCRAVINNFPRQSTFVCFTCSQKIRSFRVKNVPHHVVITGTALGRRSSLLIVHLFQSHGTIDCTYSQIRLCDSWHIYRRNTGNVGVRPSNLLHLT